jgi:hypothetical protein
MAKSGSTKELLGTVGKDGAIFVRRDCSPFEVADTVAHECRHCWQIIHPARIPIPNQSYTRTMNSAQKERDCRIFEREFWNGKEKRNATFDDIMRILTDMRIQNARAQVQAISPQYPFKQRVGLSYASSGYYPSQVKMRLVVPSDAEMERNLLQEILNG